MRNIGGSILPSGSPEVYKEKVGKFGAFQTRPMPELDTHGLFYARNTGDFADKFILVAMHSNGHSCNELAKRIIEAWKTGKSEKIDRAMEQAQYILDCGGLTKSEATMRYIAIGAF